MSKQSSSKTRLMNIRQYRWWLIADTSSTLNGTIISFAMPLAVFYITGSETRGALSDSIRLVATTFLLLFGGVAQDRYDRRLILLWHAATGAILFAGAAFAIHMEILDWPGIVILSLLMGIRSGMASATTDVMLPSIVDKDNLPHAIAINEGRDAAIQTIAPPLGGVLLRLGNAFPFTLGALLNLASYWSAYHLSCQCQPDADRINWRDAFKGFIFIGKHRILWVGIFLASPLFTLLSCSVLVAMLDFAGQGQHQTAIALLGTTMAGSMLLGAFFSKRLLKHLTGGTLFFSQLAILTIFLFAFAFTYSLWIRIFLLLPVLLLAPAANGAFMGFIMGAIPGRTTGRFVAALSVIGTGQTAILTALAGWSLENYGYQATILTMATLCCIITPILFFEGSLRNIPHPKDYVSYATLTGMSDSDSNNSK